MIDFACEDFRYPSTRYSGSKRRLLPWIWENLKDIEFNSVLDIFGGTGSVSLLFKRYGKTVFYNDLMKFNQIIGKAIIENDNVRVSANEIDEALCFEHTDEVNLISENFRGVYFLDDENKWLDNAVQNFLKISDTYKRAIIMASLFQACLAKRPFNLFHRANLYLRTANVERSFGNKTTWERTFPELIKRYALEYSNAVFSNGKKNKVVGGYNATSVNQKADLVYIDPPYFSVKSSQGTNYLDFYHFLEGLADYDNWEEKIDKGTKTKKIPISDEIQAFTKKHQIYDTFNNLIAKYSAQKIVLSYQDNGIPSKNELIDIFKTHGKEVVIFEKIHRYALSNKKSTELLFVTNN